MELVSINYDKAVASQGETLDVAVLELLLSVSLWTCTSSLSSNVRVTLLKVIASDVPRNQDWACAHIWAKEIWG